MLSALTVSTVSDNTNADAVLSLREAIALVNHGGDANVALGRSLTAQESLRINTSQPFGTNDTIEFIPQLAGSSIDLQSQNSGSRQFVILRDVQINGLDADRLTIDGQGSSQIFHITGDIDVSIHGLTLTRGRGNNGGAITIDNGRLELRSVAITDSTATGDGGGIFNDSGTLLIFDSTVANNSATSGGGITNINGIVFVANTTLSGNAAMASGGGLRTGGPSTIVNSTFANNEADSNADQNGRGGGMSVATGTNVQVLNTLFVNNLRTDGSAPEDIHGNVQASSSNNLISTPLFAGGLLHGTNSNQIGDGAGGVLDAANVIDKTLRDNGGPTATHALPLASPAVNAGSNLAAASTGLTLDQRGDGFTRIVQGAVDIGAFELQSLANLSIAAFGSGNQAEGNPGSTTPFEFTVTRTANLLGVTTVDYAVSGGTAIPRDFKDAAFPRGTVTFLAGETQKSITIPVEGDNIVEADETFFVNLINASPGSQIIGGQSQATIINDDSASVTIGDATAIEGGSLLFQVRLDSAVEGGLNVDFRTIPGTAQDQSSNQPDYVLQAGTLNFLGTAGELRTISVPTTDDSRVETDENFLVELFRFTPGSGGVPGGGGIIQSTPNATGTIQDNDTADLEFTALNVSRQEGTGGATTEFTFAVTLQQEVAGGFSLSYNTHDGTATVADGDYIDNDGTLNFAGTQGERRLITVRVNQDDKVEQDETFFVSLGAVTGTSIELSKLSVPSFRLAARIFNDDAATVSIDDVTQDENNGTMTFTVRLDHPVDVPITSGVLSIHQTTNADDFSLVNNSVTIPAGTLNGTVSVTITDDELVELDERFLVELVNLQTAGRTVMLGDKRGLGTIRNDETARIAIQNGSSDEDTGVLTLTIVTDHPIDVGVPITYVTTNSTASSNDFTPTAGTVVLPAGQSTTTIAIPLTADTVVELDEQFFVDLLTLQSSDRAVSIDGARATATILNDDSAAISITNASRTESTGEFPFTIQLDRPVDADVQVTFATESFSADTSDYVPVTGTATISKGNTSTAISVTTLSDELVERNEQFYVRLSNLTASGRDVVIGNDRGIGTILNDDTATITIQDAAADENAGTLNFTLTIDRLVDANMTVDFATATNTAAASDFTATMGTATFNAGANSTTITVPLTSDSLVELDEQFFVNLSNIQSAQRSVLFGDNQAVGTIRNDDHAELSIHDAFGFEDDGPIRFAISLSQPVDTDILVDLATSFDVAGSQDFNPINQTVTIPAGSTTTPFDVAVNVDDTVELDEQFMVRLSNLQPNNRNVTLVDTEAVGQIINDDLALISVDDVLQEESAESLTFTISLDHTVDADVLIDYATVADSAGPSDFTPVSGTATIAAGNSFATVTVAINDDGLMEFDEQFLLNLSNPRSSGRAVSIGDAQGIATILGAGADARLSITNIAQDEDAGPMTFTVTMDSPLDEDVSVNFATMFGTAGPSDFEAQTGTITILAGEQSATITIDISSDSTTEADEDFRLNLSRIQTTNRAVTFANAQAVGTIRNDDIALVAIQDATQTENDGRLEFTVTVIEPLDVDILVDFTTRADTANVDDYDPTNGTLVIPAGAASATILVNLIDDQVVELTERFDVVLSNVRATNRAVALADSRGIGTIINDDQATLTISDASGNEDSGMLIFDVALSAVIDADVEFTFGTTTDSAFSNDFTTVSGNLRFNAGTTTATIQVPLQADSLVERDEIFFVQGSALNPAGRDVRWLKNQGQGTIINDDAATISISDQTGNEDSGSLIFTVAISQPVDTDIFFNFATVAGSAGSTDYTPSAGTATIPAGENAVTLPVILVADNIVELDEDFFIQISNLQVSDRAVTLIDDSGRGVIQDDDIASLSIRDVIAFEGSGGEHAFQFVVSLDSAVDTPFQVDFTTFGESATATDGDYLIPADRILTFAGTAGEQQTFEVIVVSDSTHEPDESFRVQLANLQANGRRIEIAVPEARGIIRNDDLATGQATIVDQHITNSSINGSYRELIAGNFDNFPAQHGFADDLLFWNPLTGENRLIFGNGGRQDNPIPIGAVNGNDFTHILAGEFNSAAGSDLFLWNPTTGRNRLIHTVAVELGEIEVTIQSNIIAPSAINGNDFQHFVAGNFDDGGLTDLFFWNPSDGRNRLAHLQTGSNDSETIANIQTNVVAPTLINGNYRSIHVGQFIAEGPEELLFFNLQSGENRRVSFDGDVLGQSTQFGGFQSDFVPPTAFNGSEYQQIEIGDFNGDSVDDVFAWSSTTGANRIALSNLTPSTSTNIVDRVVDPGAINGDEYERVVRLTDELFSSPETDELFFWNPATGRNRIAVIVDETSVG